MTRAFWWGLIAAACLLAATPAAAQSRLFSSDEPLRLTLTGPLQALIRARKIKNPYPATLAVTGGAEAATIPLEIRARGISRRVLGICDIPPLQLRFDDKAALKGTVFRGQKKLKLVTYCQDRGDYEQRIMLEYLAYRLYGTVTPMGFRVRPAQVTYHNSGSDKGVTRFGFLIEDDGELADRNHVELLTLAPHQITAAQFDQRGAARATLFEYMIGNLDWDFLAAAAGEECCHNSRFVAPSGVVPLRSVTPLIYDFDSSGLIDAPYALPPAGLPVEKITQRYFRGYCTSNGEVPAAIAEFKAHRADMTALITGQPQLTDAFRTKALRYLDGFFATLDDPAKVQKEILSRCR